MKSLLAVAALAALAVAELPPSNSYLPPSPTSRNAGYPQGPQSGPTFPGAPQVIAARNQEQGGHLRGNGFSRSGSYDHPAQGRLGAAGGQGYEENSSLYERNEVNANSEPANYNFGYMVSDFNEGTDFGHHEERLEEKAQGQYHVVLPDGRKQTVSYEADARGFKPQISYQDSEEHSGYDQRANGGANARAGYDANANANANAKANARHHGNGYQSGGHVDTRAY